MRNRTTNGAAAILAMLVVGICAPRLAEAQGGVLDTSFNGAGKVLTDFTGGGGFDQANAVTIDADGRIIVAGVAAAIRLDETTRDFALARYNPDGSLDTSFGNGTGKVVTGFDGGFPVDEASAVAVDSHGRIVVAGTSYSSTTGTVQAKVALVRYNPDGMLDTSFGLGGKVVTSFGQSPTWNRGLSVAIDALDRVIVAGETQALGLLPPGDTRADILVARFDTSGSPDGTFGAGGRVRTDFTDVWCPPPVSCPPSSDYGKAVAIDSAGRIVLAGSTQIGGINSDFAIVRYNTDGTFDSTFTDGTLTGRIRVDFATRFQGADSADVVTSMALQNLGSFDRIIVGGYYRHPSVNNNLPVYALEFTIDGANNGWEHAVLGGSFDVPHGVAWSPIGGQNIAGSIVLAGVSSDINGTGDFALFRFNANGTPSGTFGDQGKVLTNFGDTSSYDAAYAMTIDPKGRIVAAGYSNANGNFDFAIARYRAIPEADLAVTKTAAPVSAVIDDTVSYTLTVRNDGPDEATNVVVSDNLPSGLTFSSCSGTNGGVCGGAGSSRTISFATLAVGATATITLQAAIDPGLSDGTTLDNSASVESALFDPDQSNNTASASIAVRNRSDLLLSQTVAKLAGRELKYSIQVANLGPYAAAQLSLVDPLPTTTRLVSVSPAGWACSAPPAGSVGTVSCTLAALAANATATLTIVVKTTAPGNVDVSNTATVTALTNDPNSANNSATLVTRVSGK